MALVTIAFCVSVLAPLITLYYAWKRKAADVYLAVAVSVVSGILAYSQWCFLRYRTEINRVKTAYADIRLLEFASGNFLKMCKDAPLLATMTDKTFEGASQAQFIQILAGGDPLNNRNAIVFMIFPKEKLTDGRFIDPWGSPYHIVLDLNGDEVCETRQFGRLENRRVAIWTDHGPASWRSPTY